MAKSFRERIGDLLDMVREPMAEYGIDRLRARSMRSVETGMGTPLTIPGDRSRLFDLKEYRNEWAH